MYIYKVHYKCTFKMYIYNVQFVMNILNVHFVRYLVVQGVGRESTG